ncbi:hypothetical protein [Acinetobacter johnsonii]|uniref:hypothetical protein n=1 Tax=Acinetobacter johnsonii TaxID=40214 RepID=UPI0011E6A17E|nr:hypothetical protein [Acinetobacter johnsonii]QEK36928.1 hypothetical protein FYN22_14285 [Acinetobacter johnsonii]
MNISTLEEQIHLAEEVLSKNNQTLDKNDRFKIASFNSFKEHLNNLRKQLHDLQLRREKEILEVRFIGDKACNGSLPLMLHATLSKGLAESLITLSTKVRTPKKHADFVNQSDLDLRLANIVSGSTKFIISLEIQPDLFGWSLSQNTLSYWFSFFQSLDNPETNQEIFSIMGNKGIASIKSMLSALKSNNLDFEINWDSHHNQKHYWMGNTKKIDKALNFLNELVIQEPLECEISGTIQNLDRSGKITLVNEDKKIYRIRLEKTVLSEIEKLRINQFVTLKVIKNISTHPTFDKVIESYDFINII